jgi:hypothetical protein
MPTMTPAPEQITMAACSRWAHQQNEETIQMWGLQDSGDTSSELAIHRLTSQCLGEPVADIVGFGSSSGFDDEYCSTHPKVAICVK